MIKAIIVDDEPINIGNLKSLLAQHCPQVQVAGTATNASEARTLVSDLGPDVVFLDIEMPDQNGFEFLRSLPSGNFEVIFVTAFDSYAIAAIKFSALDYLLKPINTAELQDAVTRAEHAVASKKRNARLDHLLDRLDANSSAMAQKIALPTQKEIHLVAVSEIVRCESSNNYTTFYLLDGRSLLISKPIYEYEELLTPYGFIRCHQSHLVNKTHVVRILNEDSGYLVMHPSNERVPISKLRKAEVKTLLLR